MPLIIFFAISTPFAFHKKFNKVTTKNPISEDEHNYKLPESWKKNNKKILVWTNDRRILTSTSLERVRVKLISLQESRNSPLFLYQKLNQDVEENPNSHQEMH